MMHSRLTIMWLLVAGFALAGCETIIDPGPVEVRELTAQEKQAVASDNRFGLRLFRELSHRQPGENVFISPLSVSLALGMTLDGANGETQAAMERTLERAGLSPEEINEAYRGLIDLLVHLDPRVVVQIANSIWYRQGFTVEPAFLETNQTYFDAEVRVADFDDPGTVDAINGWVDEKTRGKITKIIEQIGPDVVMYLINAVYFKGTWRYEFDPEETREAPFYQQDGTTQPVEMMTLEGDLPYYATDRFQAVDLPYGDSLFSMTVILPHPDESIDSLAASISQEDWDTWTGNLRLHGVRLELPKFKLEYKETLNEVLTAMGMDIAFTGLADFTGISKDGGLTISRVLHKTFVEVNEEGTEAAAVTIVEVWVTSGGGGGGPLLMRVDRPFLFAIRERHSGTILFIGKMAAPPAG